MNVLVKPRSDSDGNLVILMDNSQSLHLVDVTTGEVIEQGRNVGASNGRGATFRFTHPGASYKNVGLMDDKGNIILTLRDAGDRVQFDYKDYDALVATPVSTIDGYRWDNSANQRAQAEGRPSNADIGSMTSEEYLAYLDQQQKEAEAQQQSQEGSAGAGAAGAVGGAVAQEVGKEFLGGSSSGAGASAAEISAAQSTAAAAGESQFVVGNTVYDTATGSAVASTTGEGAGAGASTTMSQAATYAAMAYEVYQAWKAFSDNDNSKNDRSKETAKHIGLAVADYWTAGGATAANEALMQTPIGRQFDKKAKEYDHLSPILLSGLMHKSTKGYQQQRMKELADTGNEASAAFLAESRQKANDNDNTWDSGKYAGEKWSFEKALDLAKDDPTHFVGVYGNFQAVGDKWLTTPEEKQKEFVRRAIEEGLYSSAKGDVLFEGDKLDRAKQLYDEVMGSAPAKQPISRPTPETPAQAPTETPPALAFENGNPSIQPPASAPGRGGANGPLTRSMVQSNPSTEPPISGFEQIDGASLPPPGADNAAMALSFLQSAPSRSWANSLLSEAFNPQKKTDVRANFADLQGVF